MQYLNQKTASVKNYIAIKFNTTMKQLVTYFEHIVTYLFYQLDNLAAFVWTYFRNDQFTDYPISSRAWRPWTFNRFLLDNLDLSQTKRGKTTI